MATYNGQLHANKIMSGIYNMIISQYVSPSVVEGLFTDLHAEAVDEVGLAGDTKLYYFVQPLASYDWDETDTNVLSRKPAASPYCQAITIDKFRQCMITLDSYLSKQAWADEGSFNAFHSVMLGQLQATKKINETGIVNAYVGTTKSAVVGDVEVDESEVASLGQGVAEVIADLEVELKDLNRTNDLGYVRAYNPEDIRIVINHKYANKIKFAELPEIFHKDFFDTVMAKAKVLPAKYFGTVNAAAKTADGTATRSLIEQDIGTSHYYPGDLIKATEVAPAGTSYQEDADVIGKVMMKDSVKMLSAFTVSTSFFNAKNLSENTYLTWGYSNPQYLLDRPFLTIVRKD